jgi:hypothetical protein
LDRPFVVDSKYFVTLGIERFLDIIQCPFPHQRRETDSVSKTLCSSEYWMMDKVKELSNPEVFFYVL